MHLTRKVLVQYQAGHIALQLLVLHTGQDWSGLGHMHVISSAPNSPT